MPKKLARKPHRKKYRLPFTVFLHVVSNGVTIEKRVKRSVVIESEQVLDQMAFTMATIAVHRPRPVKRWKEKS